MLGSKEFSVRLGGIYALARLAREHPADYHTPIKYYVRTFGRRHVYKRLFYSPEDYEHSLRKAGFTIGRVQFFPLRLDIEKCLPHCQVIREMPEAFRSAISFREYDGRFSIEMRAASLPEGDGSDSLAVKEFVQRRPQKATAQWLAGHC